MWLILIISTVDLRGRPPSGRPLASRSAFEAEKKLPLYNFCYHRSGLRGRPPLALRPSSEGGAKKNDRRTPSLEPRSHSNGCFTMCAHNNVGVIPIISTADLRGRPPSGDPPLRWVDLRDGKKIENPHHDITFFPIIYPFFFRPPHYIIFVATCPA